MPAKPGPLRPHEERASYAPRVPREVAPGEPGIGHSFLIVTEGAVAEKLYFENLRAQLKLGPVHVHVVQPGCTDAPGLVRAAQARYEWDSTRSSRRYTEKAGANRGLAVDHVWVLFDTDVPARQGQLGPAEELAKAEGIHLGLSTPSVEFWLYLHFRDRCGPLGTSDAAERTLVEAWGRNYSKDRRIFEELWCALGPGIPKAVTRASATRTHHRAADSEHPADPSTDLDLLVRALNASVQPTLRVLR